MPCTLLGAVRYVTKVNLFLRSPQQSDCEMTPTKKEQSPQDDSRGRGGRKLSAAKTGLKYG